MELEMKISRRSRQTMSGFLSFLLALVALAGFNIVYLLKVNSFPQLFLVQLPLAGLFLGGFGLMTKKRSRLYAWWGVGLNAFVLIFTFLMIIFSLSINYKP